RDESEGSKDQERKGRLRRPSAPPPAPLRRAATNSASSCPLTATRAPNAYVPLRHRSASEAVSLNTVRLVERLPNASPDLFELLEPRQSGVFSRARPGTGAGASTTQC